MEYKFSKYFVIYRVDGIRAELVWSGINYGAENSILDGNTYIYSTNRSGKINDTETSLHICDRVKLFDDYGDMPTLTEITEEQYNALCALAISQCSEDEKLFAKELIRRVIPDFKI